MGEVQLYAAWSNAGLLLPNLMLRAAVSRLEEGYYASNKLMLLKLQLANFPR